MRIGASERNSSQRSSVTLCRTGSGGNDPGGCHVFPNATLTGGVRVGQFAYVGSGAVVAPNIVVHKYSQVGAGAIVLKDVAEGVVVAGSPAVEIGKQSKRPEF